MKTLKKNPGFFALLIGLGVLSLWVIMPYLQIFVLAVVSVIVFAPMYNWFLKHVKNQTLASVVAGVSIFLVIGIPAFLLLSIAIGQTLSMVSDWQAGLNAADLEIRFWYPWVDSTLQQIRAMTWEEIFADETLAGVIQNALKTVAKFIAASLIPLISYSVISIVNIFFYLIIVVYLFPNIDRFFHALTDVSPLTKAENLALLKRFKGVTMATIYGTVLIAALCAVFGGFIMWAVGLQTWAILAILMFLTSFIPMGSGIITYPVAVIQMLMGNWVGGLIILLWGFIVMNNIDNVVRPKLMTKGDSQMPEMATLLSAVGGIVVFGFFGFIYGPVIVGLFLTTLDFYKESTVAE